MEYPKLTPALTERDYMAAVGLMVLTGKGSTSFIQRTLGLGYNAASKLVERMEGDGILAKPNHVGKRKVLVVAPLRPTPPVPPSE